MNRTHGPLRAMFAGSLAVASLLPLMTLRLEDGDDAGTGDTEQADPAAEQDGDKPDDPDEPKPGADGKFDESVVKALRQENAAKRVAAKAAEDRAKAAEKARQDTLDAIAEAAGLKTGKAKADPDELTRQLASERTAARTAQVELAIFRASGAAGANPDRLLDSRSFMQTVADLDPAAADFAATMKTKISEAVRANDQLRAVQAAASSSADHTGGSGEKRVTTKHARLEDAIAADMAAAT
jgi:hypothetical protein